MSTTETSVIATELGLPIPSLPHAVSVSLPTWQDSLGYSEGDGRVVEALTTGYPRSFIHRSVQLLAHVCEENFGNPGERCILVSSSKLADACRSFLLVHSPSPITVRVARRALASSTSGQHCPKETLNHCQGSEEHGSSPQQLLDLHMVFFPAESFPLARYYWAYTGHGISSRRADRCLKLLDMSSPAVSGISVGVSTSTITSTSGTSNGNSPGGSVESPHAGLGQNQTMLLVQCDEELLPFAEARSVLQRRIARALRGEFSSPSEASPSPDLKKDDSGRQLLSDDDVFLYPGGMNAIWHAHRLILQTAEKTGKVVGKSICFGFPYSCTPKVLEKSGPGYYLFGSGDDHDLSEVRRVAQEAAASGNPIVALFCEVSTNPLLRTPNIVELRKIADEFEFLIVVDESIGNFVNVDIMEYADIVVTSLTKVFSGRSNVMGGSLALNPQRRHYSILRDHLKATYEDLYWHEDVVCMELNSRDFARRIDITNRNAEVVADWLWHQSEVYAGETQNSNGRKKLITNVFYPKWVTRKNYDACRRRPSNTNGKPLYPSGFGSLVTILFCDEPAARAFYDNLGCEKGPSWGTNFTLAGPYTIFAHYRELDWTAGYGVPINIVRMSVGMEDEATLLGWVKHALEAAEKAMELSS
ncbi:hypothetical protein FRC04_009605 [Tulasnella sp. 424]|nr:hypothetical protein FRC04_009605 [Tulasnella sp. 424]KAG8975904.1 hypothetical protein FRC05_004835 [Tulasnella sp. 425]